MAREPNKDRALKELNTTRQIYGKELAWRKKAAQDVLPALQRYEATTRDTIGLRKQEKLPQHIVPSIAGCTAYHRDISYISEAGAAA